MRGWLLIAAAAALPAGDVDEAATRLVSQLALPSHVGVEAEVAVGAGPGLDPAMRSALIARVVGRLRQLGLPQPRSVAAPGLDRAATDARRRGAEWLLWLDRVRDGDLVASLLHVDPGGLWAAPPAAAPAVVTARAPWSSPPVPAPPPPPPAPPPTPGLALAGPPLRALDVPGRVLALAACPDPDGRESVAALTLEAVHVLAHEGGQIRRTVPVSLVDLPRAEAPTRDPVGAIVCTDRALALGHGRLRRGYLLPRVRAAGPPIAVLGIPIGPRRDGGFWFGRLEPGLNRFASEVRAVRGDGAPLHDEVWPGRFEASVDPGRPEGWRALAVTLDDRLVRLAPPATGTATRATSAPVATTGVGHAARAIADRLVLVTTDPAASPTHDTVRAWVLAADSGALTPLGPDARIEGAVYASTIARLGTGRLYVVLAAYQPATERTAILLWRLEGGA